jgi:aspartyl-tRNA(Asn)/glutamyl-tRNA(Gln) amidotransferase subunit C
MELKDKDLEHLEKLARVELSGESREKLRGQLSTIIEFVRKLQSIDTSAYEAKAYLGGFEPELRLDEALECLDTEEVLEAAPDRQKDYFRVPPVIDREES